MRHGNANGSGNNLSPERIRQIIRHEGSYVHFFPAVRLGSALAGRDEYQELSWADVMPEAQAQWEAQHERPWEEFKEVVRQAWAEVKTQFRDGPEAPKDPNSYEARFLKHYQSNYATSLFQYDQYAPAYYYGYDLAVDGRLRDKGWGEIEPEARYYWNNESYAGLWEEFQEAARYAWDEVRQAQAINNTPQPYG